MDKYEIYDELQDILTITEADSFPELHDYLSSIMDEEDGV